MLWGEGLGEGGMDWEFGISRYKLLYIEQINSKVLLYSIGDYIQDPVKTTMEKNMRRNVCVCITESLC